MITENEDEIDGCDVDICIEDEIADEDLPIVEGGVAIEQKEDNIDGCDTPVYDQDATPDEQLPAANGGGSLI